MYYFRAEYPTLPPGTLKGDMIIHWGGQKIVCKNTELVIAPKLVASAPAFQPNLFDDAASPRGLLDC